MGRATQRFRLAVCLATVCADYKTHLPLVCVLRSLCTGGNMRADGQSASGTSVEPHTTDIWLIAESAPILRFRSISGTFTQQ